MQTCRTLLVDAFTDEPLAGNAAGVVPDADDLTADQMQAIARELSVSETAFFVDSEDADRRVRYFTPTTEIDLCGHATVASHVHLLEDDRIEPGTHALETNVGVLDIDVEADGTVWMTQDDPEVEPVDIEYEQLGAALGIDPAALRDVGEDLPLAVSSTGLPILIVPVNFLEHVGGADPDMEAIEALGEAVGALGVYAFTFDAIEADSTLHGRMFAPAVGIPEDPVTGTASGSVAAYLDTYDAFDNEDESENFPDELRLEQGHFVDRPGYVRVRVDNETGVRVGGRATTALDGSLVAPDAADDDIIEC
ncbi:PhzF family phenazine biosynthesis protein [Haladaptatus sp. W1]|uniref:PhzF family phenazine biosynthesis protein n=1 Tax=Haladaptatus sp. W1 TaxID=1897478 RepID=UPI000849941D|nr:PhzF family phenazine biosynthesis protein [Haladaptatus sp. W1]ODR79268.1 PhzF family phenazine biosynthesis protein [Haladaptatus sp. W1]ODR83069.1 PhzF family phenazine biosynthesis protein [Haladaptatus sp. W1]